MKYTGKAFSSYHKAQQNSMTSWGSLVMALPGSDQRHTAEDLDRNLCGRIQCIEGSSPLPGGCWEGPSQDPSDSIEVLKCLGTLVRGYHFQGRVPQLHSSIAITLVGLSSYVAAPFSAYLVYQRLPTC